jgi:excisionase family DNA binding protein
VEDGNDMRDGNGSVLTIPEVAADLRCSKAHVYNVIKGRVSGVSALPAIRMGRRKLILRASLEEWKKFNQCSVPDSGMLSLSPEVDVVGRV